MLEGNCCQKFYLCGTPHSSRITHKQGDKRFVDFVEQGHHDSLAWGGLRSTGLNVCARATISCGLIPVSPLSHLYSYSGIYSPRKDGSGNSSAETGCVQGQRVGKFFPMCRSSERPPLSSYDRIMYRRSTSALARVNFLRVYLAT